MEKEKIERAAIELCTTEGQEEWVKDYGVSCFKDGARWRIDSAWHDVSEVPEANKRVLVCFKYVIGEYVYYRIRAFKPNVLKNWNMDNFSLDKVLYWAYLDDLLPERKEETNGGR